VAVTLLGLLAMLMTGGVRFGTRVWERSAVAADALAEVHAVREFLRRRIAEARPLDAGAEADEPPGEAAAPAAFRGSAGAMEFVTAMPSYVAPGGLHRVAIAGGADGLHLAWRPAGAPWDAAEDGAGSGRRLLLDRLAGVSLSYFGSPEGRGAAGWHDAWPAAAGMPALVRLAIVFPEGDPREWPDLIVALPAGEGSGR